MRPIPRFWTQHTDDVADANGDPWRLSIWGWSTESLGQAREVAAERLEQVAARLRAGQQLDQHYYGRLPLREEILGEITDASDALVAVITRNRYGAEVLNTDTLLIADVDFPPPRKAAPAGLWSRLRSRGQQPQEASSPSVQDETVQRLRDFASANQQWGTRVYRTRAGLRVLITGTQAPPGSALAQQILTDLGSDPIYVRLCVAHHNYRARLTPKPWRIGVGSLTVGWPVAAGPDADRLARWAQAYLRAGEAWATTQLLFTDGAAPSRAEEQVIGVHDQVSKATSGLPLA